MPQNEMKTDSLRAQFSLEIYEGDGNVQKLSAVLFSVPKKRYRLELSTTMGIGVASLLWTDSLWKIVFPTEKTYLQGNGYMVGVLGNADIPLVNIHEIAGFFNDSFLPENYETLSVRDSSGLKITTGNDKLGNSFSFAKQGGKILWLIKKTEQVFFNLPEISVKKQDKDFLKIKIKKVKKDISWGQGIWKLPTPYGYQKLQ